MNNISTQNIGSYGKLNRLARQLCITIACTLTIASASTFATASMQAENTMNQPRGSAGPHGPIAEPPRPPSYK